MIRGSSCENLTSSQFHYLETPVSSDIPLLTERKLKATVI